MNLGYLPLKKSDFSRVMDYLVKHLGAPDNMAVHRFIETHTWCMGAEGSVQMFKLSTTKSFLSYMTGSHEVIQKTQAELGLPWDLPE